jgi:hypothetical protein
MGDQMNKNKSSRKTIRVGLLAALLAIGLAACTINLSGGGDGGEPTATLPPVPTFTDIPLQPTAPPTDLPPIPGAPTDTPFVGPGSTATGAACLPGTWQIDHPSVLNYMTLSMLGVGEFDFTPLASSGKLELQIIPGQINLLAENFKVDIGVNIWGVANVNVNNVYIQANGAAAYTATDSQVDLTGITYNVIGTLESATASFSLDIEDLLNIAHALGFAGDVNHPYETHKFYYTCSGDILSIVVNEFASVSFNRSQ